MKQVVQSFSSGLTEVVEVPEPVARPGFVLVRNSFSLISSGTERMVIDFARQSLLQKARSRPDLVSQVLRKVKREGLLGTFRTARIRLDAELQLGYSCAGTVIAVGADVSNFERGDRVACAGAGYAVHAELANVPRNLVVHVPDSVPLEDAAFTTLGAIALHGVRLAEPQLGETVAVIGLGLVGLLATQLCVAAGCRVFGMDPDPVRGQLAVELGCDRSFVAGDEMTGHVQRSTSGRGCDGVLIAAAAKNAAPVVLAGDVARDRGRVVAIGAVNVEIPRRTYFAKELSFQISRSYGPGRYDHSYEEAGVDYPIGFVRWTENRNMEAFVACLGSGAVSVKPLISRRFPIADARLAYEMVVDGLSGLDLGLLLEYPEPGEQPERKSEVPATPQELRPVKPARVRPKADEPVRVSFIGAGSFARAVALPAARRVPGIEFVGVCTATGPRARSAAKKFSFTHATCDPAELLADDRVHAVAVMTRHGTHAELARTAMAAGKHMFIEKPLALRYEELESLRTTFDAVASHGDAPTVVVGFNRRYAPMVQQIAELFAGRSEPCVAHIRVNAGYISPGHWVHDAAEGGGRLLGEVCHFVDLLGFLIDSRVVRVQALRLPDLAKYRSDNLVATLAFADKSLATINYVANGDPSIGKERLELFGAGRVAIMDDYQRLELAAQGKRRVVKRRRQDKGHRAQWEAFSHLVRSDPGAEARFQGYVASTLATLGLLDSLVTGAPVDLATSDSPAIVT